MYKAKSDHMTPNELQKSVVYVVNDFPSDPANPGINVTFATEHVFVNSPLQLLCKVQQFRPIEGINWMFQGRLDKKPTNVKHLPHLNFSLEWDFDKNLPSYHLILHVRKAGLEHTGRYTCRSEVSLQRTTKRHTIDKSYLGGETNVTSSLDVSVFENVSPVFGSNASASKLTTNYSREVTIFCQSEGVPQPTIQWFKDGQKIGAKSDGVLLSANNQKLTIPKTVESDAGVYTCRAVNFAGIAERHFELVVVAQSLKMSTMSWIFLASLLICILIVLVLLILLGYLKNKDNKRVPN